MSNYALASDRRFARPAPLLRWLALGAVAGPTLFTVAWLVLGAVSPGFTIWDETISPYSPISAGISGLGLGPTAPYMNAAFVISGALVVTGAIGGFALIPGLGRRARVTYTVAIGLAGAGLALDGLFTLESIMAHLVGFGLAIGGFVVGYFLVGRGLRRLPGWRRIGTLTLVASPVTVALTVLYFATFSPTAEGARTGIAGLTERILVVEVVLPLAVIGWTAFTRSRATDRPRR